MKRWIIIWLLLLSGCILPPVCYDDCGDLEAKVQINGKEYIPFANDDYTPSAYTVTFGTTRQLTELYMMDSWSTFFPIYIGDTVYLEVKNSTSPLDISIHIFQNLSKVDYYRQYVHQGEKGILMVAIVDHYFI